MQPVLSGPIICYTCPTHIVAIFDCLFSALFTWHALELTPSIYVVENMEMEPHLPHLAHPRGGRVEGREGRQTAWQAEQEMFKSTGNTAKNSFHR